jgi:hypothetical protein
MSDKWFYAGDGRQHGPYAAERLTQLAASGELQPATLVWKEGMGGWQPTSAVSELASLRFADTPAPQKATPTGETVFLIRRDAWKEAFGGCGYGAGIIIGLITLAVFFVFLPRPHDPQAWENRLDGFAAGVVLGPVLAWLWGLAVAAGKKGPGLKKCPYCAEWVKKGANLCKFCHQEMPPAVPTKA